MHAKNNPTQPSITPTSNTSCTSGKSILETPKENLSQTETPYNKILCTSCHSEWNRDLMLAPNTTQVIKHLDINVQYIYCPNCNVLLLQCVHCSKNVIMKKNAIRDIKGHIQRTHNGEYVGNKNDSWDNGGNFCPLFVDDQSSNEQSSIPDEEESSTPPSTIMHNSTEHHDDYADTVNFTSLDDMMFEEDFFNEFNANEDNDVGEMDQLNSTNTNTTHLYQFQTHDFSYFGRLSNQFYFYEEYLHGKHGGKRGIVFRCFTRLMCVSDISSEEEARLVFQIAKLLFNCTRKYSDLTMNVISSIISMYQCAQSKLSIRIPTNVREAHSMILSGRFSLFDNIPNVDAIRIGNHACISLNMLLDHVLGHGIELAWLQDSTGHQNTDGINGTRKAQELLQKLRTSSVTLDTPTVVAIGHIILWSDGFLRTWVKQKDNSIWILTATICPPMGYALSPFHTYCLAIGNSQEKHDRVIDYYMRELRTMRIAKQRYCAIQNTFISTAFDLLVYIADRPERDSILHTLNGGTYGKRSRHAAYIDQAKLPSCRTCSQKLILHVRNTRTQHRNTHHVVCNRCCNWEFYAGSNALNYHPCPKAYPRTLTQNHNPVPDTRSIAETHIIPRELSFQWLRCGADLAYHELRQGNWLKSNAEIYLKSMAINHATIETIWKKSQNYKKNIPDESEHIPLIWKSDYDFDIFVDCVMHQIFHGVVPSVMEIVHKHLTSLTCCATFFDIVNPSLLSCALLRLSYCKLKNLPPTLWLAEDVLGFTRIIQFVYGKILLHDLIENDVVKTSIMEMINALHVMCAVIMTKTAVCTETISIHIKIFLNACHHFCKCVHDDTIADFWKTKCNFVSLLNLPKQINDYGSVRFYWEGSRERFIQEVKRVLLSLRKTQTYLSKKLILLHKMTAFNWMINQFDIPDDTHYKPRLFYVYKSKNSILEKFRSGDCISGFHLEEYPQQVNVAYADGRFNIHFMAFTFSFGVSRVSLCGMFYCKFSEIDMPPIRTTKKEVFDITDIGALMVPYSDPKTDFNNQYSIVYSDWDVLRSNGQKGLPELCRGMFNN